MNFIDILVTGGSGLVGHALQKINPDAIYLNSKDFDLRKEKEVKAMFEEYRPDIVIHLAAKVGGIFKNINYPADLIYENVLINSNVIHYAYKYNVKRLVGVLSNCAYPDKVESYPMKEKQFYNGPPQSTNFAYAYSKRTLAVQIESYNKQYGCDFSSIIPCNLYGPYDEFNEKEGHLLGALIKRIHNVKIENKKEMKLFGSGKPLRQYLYSGDLAKIIMILINECKCKGLTNIAPKNANYPIAEIAEIVKEVIGAKDIEISFDNTSPDGQYRKDLSIEKLLGLIGDFRFTSLKDGINETYEWYLKSFDAFNEKGL